MSRWYYFASGIFLLLAMEAFGFVSGLAYGAWEGKPGDKITQFANLVLIMISVLLFIRGIRQSKGISFGGFLVIAAVGILLLSALWSIDPQATVRRAILYLFVVLGAIGVANNLDADEFMDLLGVTCFLSVVASFVLLAFAPSNALMPDIAYQAAGMTPESYEMRGIFSHKNVLGQVMAAGTLASIHGIRLGGRRRLLNLVLLVVFVGTAFATGSATSLLAIFFFCAASVIIALLRKGGVARVVGISCIIGLVPIGVVAALDTDVIFAMIGKDPTLTGRTDLWSYVIDYIYRRPMLGWGFSAFWSPNSPAAIEISAVLKWYVPQAHNGLLEMLLEVGLVGSAFFIFLWLRNIAMAIRCLRTAAAQLAITSLLCCVGIFLVGISETVLMEPFQIFTSIFFIVGLQSENAVRLTRWRSYYVQRGRLPSHFPIRP